MISRGTQASIVIFVIFSILFHAPVVEVFNSVALVLGIPVLFFYFILSWLALILCTWFVTRKLKDKDHGI